nr:LysR family transcriptional regulator [Ideonella sp. B508-1]
MNLRFVEGFHWAVSLKSVTRAAERLHITQSALSSRISALEEELGVVLVDRRDKQFRLTIAGQRFHALALRLLEVHRQVKEEMGSNAGRPMALRIGAIESVVHSWLTGWLQQMRNTHPDFALELTVETSPVLVDQVRRGVGTVGIRQHQLGFGLGGGLGMRTLAGLGLGRLDGVSSLGAQQAQRQCNGQERTDHAYHSSGKRLGRKQMRLCALKPDFS